MRLGSHPCDIVTDSNVHKLYGIDTIGESHRHRYEIDKDKIELLMKTNKATFKDINARFVSTSSHKNHTIYEMLEIVDHTFFVGCQFHPEFLSRLEKPHSLFVGLLSCNN